MTLYVIDYAYSRPSPADIKQAGFSGAMRYLSKSPGKNLSASERDALHAAGLSIGLVWETTADRAGQGSAAGTADARSANQQADALNFPADCPLFYAVDFDANPSAVEPYFRGVIAAGGRAVGIYGGIRVVDAALSQGWATYGWQTVAWSGGKVSTLAHLYQYVGHGHGVAVIPNQDYDDNRTLKPYPMWGLAGSIGGADLDATQAAELSNVNRIAGDLAAAVTNIQQRLQAIEDKLASSSPSGLTQAQVEAALKKVNKQAWNA